MATGDCAVHKLKPKAIDDACLQSAAQLVLGWLQDLPLLLAIQAGQGMCATKDVLLVIALMHANKQKCWQPGNTSLMKAGVLSSGQAHPYRHWASHHLSTVVPMHCWGQKAVQSSILTPLGAGGYHLQVGF